MVIFCILNGKVKEALEPERAGTDKGNIICLTHTSNLDWANMNGNVEQN